MGDEHPVNFVGTSVESRFLTPVLRDKLEICTSAASMDVAEAIKLYSQLLKMSSTLVGSACKGLVTFASNTVKYWHTTLTSHLAK